MKTKELPDAKKLIMLISERLDVLSELTGENDRALDEIILARMLLLKLIKLV